MGDKFPNIKVTASSRLISMGTVTAQKNWTFPHTWEPRFVHSLFIYLFQQYLYRGAQFSEAGLNGALFNINLPTNNILQNTKFQITKVLT